MKLIVLCGPPGAGKSTYAAQYPQEWIVPIDRCRQMAHDMDDHPHASWEAHRIFYTWIEARAACGKPLVVDATSLGQYKRRRLRYLAERYHLVPHLVIFTTALDACLANNRKRSSFLPDDAVEKAHRKLSHVLDDCLGERWASITIRS